MLTETMFALGIAGVAAVSLYAGISQAFSSVQMTREEQRATQILVEKMEALRLLSWDQLNTEGFLPSSFRESSDGQVVTTASAGTFAVTANKTIGVASGDSATVTGSEGQQIVYVGQTRIDLVKVPKAYSQHMRRVEMTITWRSGNKERSRSMETFVSQYGIQNYSF